MGKQRVDLPLSSVEARGGRRFSLPLRHELERSKRGQGRGGVIPSICIGKMGGFPSLVPSSLGGLLARESITRRTPNFIIKSRRHQSGNSGACGFPPPVITKYTKCRRGKERQFRMDIMWHVSQSYFHLLFIFI